MDKIEFYNCNDCMFLKNNEKKHYNYKCKLIKYIDGESDVHDNTDGLFGNCPLKSGLLFRIKGYHDVL